MMSCGTQSDHLSMIDFLKYIMNDTILLKNNVKLRRARNCHLLKSTVDYIGAVQGIPVCFDAKECAVRTFPLQNIHPHQIAFMKEFEAQGGVAFIILSFTAENEIYYVPFDVVNRFWERMEEGGRKSFTYDEVVPEAYRIRSHRDMYVHYLEGIQQDLDRKEEKGGDSE